MNHSAHSLHAPLRKAAFEALEQRRLLAFSGSDFALPFVNDFSAERNGVEDADGQNTGFPIVQGNTAGDEYQPDLIDLDLDDGLLLITSRGDAAHGGNFGTDNSLANGLQLPFDAKSGTWTIHTRISTNNAALTQFNEAFEQAGILFGPTQDNFVKLIYGHDGNTRVVQFVAETRQGSTFTYPGGESGFKSAPATVQGVNLANADYIDLWLSGNPETGVLSAQYRVEGGQTFRFNDTITLTGATKEAFFRETGARAGLIVQHKHEGDPITVAFDEFGVTRNALPSNQPAVEEARPAAGATDVDRDAFFAVDLHLPNAGIDESTLNDSTVRLIRVEDGQQVPARLNTTGGGDAIILTPLRALDAQTQYRFEITSGVTDLYDVPMVPYSETITTGYGLSQATNDVAFDQIELSSTAGQLWTSVTVGPDNKLYATTAEGQIVRWAINGNGTLGASQTINTITTTEGGPRVVTGLTFDPDATASNLIAYVTHTDFNDVTTDQPDELGQDFTGKVTKLSGANLQTAQDLVVGLPRSIRDHLTNQPVFGPDGRLYVPQGANTAMGAPDAAWGFRNEHLLNAAILAIDVDAITSPVNVHTEDSDPYNPFAANAPVQIYATGVRNAYDLIWHSNGNLYAPTNGSAAGGNTPQSPQPDSSEFGDDRTDLDINGPYSGDFVPGLNNVPQTQNDYLFRIEQGGYYGHPNPTRDEWVLNGGNPTSSADAAEVSAYPVGTQPDRNYRGFVYDFGKNYSPNGSIEYTADTFGGALQGKLLVTRYSGGDDVVALELDANGNVVEAQTGIIGFSGFADPLDIAQTADGKLYVAQFGAQEGGGSKITLLRPVESGGRAVVDDRREFFNAPAGEASTVNSFTIRNAGSRPLLLSSYTLGITGPDKLAFRLVDPPSQAVAVAPGASHSFDVVFEPPEDAEVGDVLEATVFIRTSDETAPEVGSKLQGLVTSGSFDASEPSLQYILDLYGFDIDTGDDDPTNNAIVPGGDMVEASLFRRVDPNQPVTVVPIASFGPDTDPAATVGFYQSGDTSSRRMLQEIQGLQTVDPAFTGAVKFSPPEELDETFGLWMQTPSFRDDGRARVIYSEDQLNTWEPNASERGKFFVYPIQLDASIGGGTIENAYVVAFEEFETATDANDVVLVIRNVAPVAEDGGKIQVINQLQVPYSNRLVFSQIPPEGREAGQQVRNSQQVTLRNIGSEPITLTGVTTSGEFSTSGFTPGTELAVGQSTTITVNFTATADDVEASALNQSFFGSLVVANNDPNVPSTTIELAGSWQRYTEDGQPVGVTPGAQAEPDLAELMEIYGFNVDVGSKEARDNNGVYEAVGEEVLSPFWRASGPDTPIEVYQLNAYHTVPTEDFFGWYPRGDIGASQTVFTHEGAWGQSLLPAINGGSGLAAGTFEPGTQEFGIRVSNEFSEPEENFVGPSDQGHHIRFFPLRDREGDIIEDTWLVAMDFIGFNFDFNDNVYIVRGMEPADLAPAPTGVEGFRDNNGEVVVDWGEAQGVDGYHIYRSIGGRDSFTKAHTGTITSSFFTDTAPPSGEVFYRVYSVDNGELGMFSDVRIA